MKVSCTKVRRYLQNLTIGDFKFEGVVDSFTYFGSVLNNENKISTDVRSNIMVANHAYLAHIKLFRSKFLSQNTELKLHKTLIQSILT
jgi:hypothetical protein